MQSKPLRFLTHGIASAIALAGLAVYGQTKLLPPPPLPPGFTNATNVLVWDADLKEVSPELKAPFADFSFSVTNVSDSEVIIKDAHASCGCTEAKLPSKPWHLAAHSNGVIKVSVNLAGKSGVLYKFVDVYYGTNSTKRLNLKVNMPQDPAMFRSQNQQMAMNDRQMVFKGKCAECHVDKAKGKMGKELYVAACGICHEATPRATMVPDLHALNHSTDYIYWKVWIAQGKPGTLMPAFSTKQGGPLSDEQIESLAAVLSKSFPSGPRAAIIKTSAADTAAITGNPAKKN